MAHFYGNNYFYCLNCRKLVQVPFLRSDNLYNYPSRSEKRLSKFYQAAENACFKIDGMLLYKSEIKSLKNKGFEIFDIKEFSYGKNLFSATVSWENAFGDAIPHLVYSYIHRVIETFPTSCTNESFAKELFVIAKRAQLSKK